MRKAAPIELTEKERGTLLALSRGKKVSVRLAQRSAIILCSTTDPYQVIRHPDPSVRNRLANHRKMMVRRALELIRDHSTLNVRILTRSTLARRDFDLFRSFGNRLLFGMSLPTLRDDLAEVYEPGAPAPNQRLAALRAARQARLHVFVAMAPRAGPRPTPVCLRPNHYALRAPRETDYRSRKLRELPAATAKCFAGSHRSPSTRLHVRQTISLRRAHDRTARVRPVRSSVRVRRVPPRLARSCSNAPRTGVR